MSRALTRLVDENPTAASEEPHLDLLLLRRLRALGPRAGGDEAVEGELVSAVAESLKWRRAHAPRTAESRQAGFHHAAGELPHSDWAAGYLQVGVRCGRAMGGHPVKIERPGRHDVVGIERYRGKDGQRSGELLLRLYYYAMLEDM